MSYKVLIPQDITPAGKNYLLEKGYEIKMGSGISIPEIARDVEDCDAILARTAPFPAEVIRAGKKLKVIARHGIGVDNIDVETATDLGIYVVNAPLSNGNAVAEHTIGFIIALSRNMVYIDREFRKGDYAIRNRLPGIELENRVLGLIGVGRIGTMVANKAALGLGMKVIGYDPYVVPEKVTPNLELIRDWDTVFRQSDFICLHLPATRETRGIIGRKEFEMMKPEAYLINVARGEVVNEADLIEALQKKTIAGAALDVFEQEPPLKENPLFRLDNVIVSPHNAALTREAMDKMGLHAAIGIDEVLSGKTPSWPVNKPRLENRRT